MGAPDRQHAMLTEDQRRGLVTDWRGKDRKTRSYHQRKIVERVRSSLKDFQLLCDHLSDQRRSEIFEAEPVTPEYWDIRNEVSDTIQFLYIGLGGEHHFRRPLTSAVVEAERELGNIESQLELEPRFAVDPYWQSDIHDIVDSVETEVWDELRLPDLFEFVTLAKSLGAIDFEAIYDDIEREPRTVKRTLDSTPRRTTRLSKETLKRLETYQQEGDTYDDALNRVLDAAEE